MSCSCARTTYHRAKKGGRGEERKGNFCQETTAFQETCLQIIHKVPDWFGMLHNLCQAQAVNHIAYLIEADQRQRRTMNTTLAGKHWLDWHWLLAYTTIALFYAEYNQL